MKAYVQLRPEWLDFDTAGDTALARVESLNSVMTGENVKPIIGRSHHTD
jgi:hypothetical protein